ncbi:MAG: hypothetical protein IID45_15685 [Planctomycetes bacterium]|nr:hypothetical protein [Planctomycetota bacterium]
MAAALLCGVLGALAGGLRKRGMGLALGLLLGLTLGGLSGVGGGLAGKAVEQRFAVNDMDELQRTILIHLAVWLPVGLGAGLTIGTFSGRIRSFFSIASMTTIVAAAAGAVFTIVSMFVFKTERTDRPIPDGLGNVMLWTTFVSTLVSFAAGRLLGASSSHEKTLRNDAGGSA